MPQITSTLGLLIIKQNVFFTHHYSIPWNLVDSGGIQLGLDLHFSLKMESQLTSVISRVVLVSNEKGIQTGLLLVASIYRFSKPEMKNAFVCSSERR
ncbi:MAG: hypothetical protein ACLRWA_05865 [Lachnospira sp.]